METVSQGRKLCFHFYLSQHNAFSWFFGLGYKEDDREPTVIDIGGKPLEACLLRPPLHPAFEEYTHKPCCLGDENLNWSPV